MSLDLTKPVQTRDGEYTIEIIRTDMNCPHYPVVAIMTHKRNGISDVHKWTVSGRWDRSAGDCAWDLVNVPEPPKEYTVWLNCYDNVHLAHSTREYADSICNPEARIARVKVTFVEGQMDE